jgi:hypothetical protein
MMIKQIKVMTEQDQYDALQEYNYFEMLVNTKKYVTKDEYEFIINYDKTEKNNFGYIGDYSEMGAYLNFNVYSEHDHEKRQFEMEIG